MQHIQAKAKSGQTLFDIAIEHCGTFESAYDIAKLNDLCITDALVEGQSLIMPDVVKTSVVNHFKTQQNKPATNL